jgi:16S rRNA (guanine527-N7)-methyltransferase
VQQLILNKDAYIADLGSGAGLPGVVLALAGYTQVTLIEKDAKKATFLRYVSRETNIPFVVLEQDISHVTTVYDVVVARGLAPLSDLLAYALPLMKPDGHGLFLKGETVDAEIMMAQCHYGEMTFLKKRSITHPKASLVWVSKTNDGQEGASDFNRDCQSKRRRGKNHDSC